MNCPVCGAPVGVCECWPDADEHPGQAELDEEKRLDDRERARDINSQRNRNHD